MSETLEGFNQIVALFLSEVLRSRKTSIKRAAEISSRLTEGLLKVQTEPEVLGLLTAMEKDFEELSTLKEALHFGIKESDLRIYEHEIKEYAAELSKADLVRSAKFLQDAARKNNTIQQLCLQYPDFCRLLMSSDKRPLVESFAVAMK